MLILSDQYPIAKVLMQPIIWLNELRDTHLPEVGPACLRLRQLQVTGHPIQEGFILPSTVLANLVDSIDWPDTLLQDFPHLNLKFDLEDPLATQSLLNTIQAGIRRVPVPTQWETAWSQALLSFCHPWLLLKPYLWSGPSPSPISTPLSCIARHCKNQPSAFLNCVQQLWVEVFSIQTILLLQHQGIRLDQVRVSILVQSLPCPVASGWLQVANPHCFIQTILGSAQGLWTGESLPEQWVSDHTGKVLYQQTGEQPFAHWLRPSQSVSPNSNAAIIPSQPIPPHQQQAPILTPETAQDLITLGRSLSKIPLTTPMTLTWILHRPPHGHTRELLLYYLDIDLPFPPPHPSLWHAEDLKAAPSLETALQPAADSLLRGIGVSPGQRIAPLLVAQSLQNIQPESLASSILVTPTLDTVHLPWLRAAVGCICETGSPVSHGAILARELGCPAIMGAQGATQVLQTGQWVMMDGQSGCIYPHSTAVTPPAVNDPAPSAFSTAKTRTKRLITLSHPNRLVQINPQTIDGIGLIRGEWLFLNSLTEPFPTSGLGTVSSPHWQQCQQSLRKFIQSVAPLPVFYRLIDFGAVNIDALSFSESSGFPAAGNRGMPLTAAHSACRGIGCHLLDRQLLHSELGMIQEIVADGVTNLHLILPFVRSVQEVTFCQEQLQEVGLWSVPHLPLWIMAEVPSVVYLLDQYAQLNLQGIAIGLNDFTQLLLGANRNHHDFWDCLMANQSEVMTAITELVEKAHRLGLQTMLCGELKSYPSMFLKRLIQAGLGALSVDLSDFETTHTAIIQAERELANQSVTNS